MSKQTDFIQPAGEQPVETIAFTGKAADRKPTWCKRCGRKHPRNEACNLVDYHGNQMHADSAANRKAQYE